MSQSKKSKPTGGHTPVSNKAEESLRAAETDFFVSNQVSEEPSEGKGQNYQGER
jgi:hypothetical protein